MEDGKIKVWLPSIRAGSGADVYTRRLAKALENQGMVVEISWLSKRYEVMPMLLRNMPPPIGSDIVFANSWNGFAFKRSGLPLVVVEHHCVFDPELRIYKSQLQSWYHALLIKSFAMHSFGVADAVVAVSDFTARSLRQNAGLMDVEVIFNWIDTDMFCPPTDNRRVGRPFRLLYVGNASRRKGSDLLASIMQMLGVGFELRFTAGLRADGIGCVEPNMVSLGKLTDEELARAYQECDALLFPSRFEGFGYAALEAMACGKPVVASDNTAFPELVVDGATGLLCETDNAEAFANACRMLASNPDRCLDMGLAGRQRAIESYSESAAVKPYAELIEKLVTKRRQPGFAI